MLLLYFTTNTDIFLILHWKHLLQFLLEMPQPGLDKQNFSA